MQDGYNVPVFTLDSYLVMRLAMWPFGQLLEVMCLATRSLGQFTSRHVLSYTFILTTSNHALRKSPT